MRHLTTAVIMLLALPWAVISAHAEPRIAAGKAKGTQECLPIRFRLPDTSPPPPRAADLPTSARPLNDEPGAMAAFVSQQLADANRVFAQAGLCFCTAEHRAYSGNARMESRSDRHELAAAIENSMAIDVFVVASLRDVDDPSRLRMGVHWKNQEAQKRYIILASYSARYVLAHELGHYLGHRQHSPIAGNIMSYTRLAGIPTLSRPQRAQWRSAARDLLNRLQPSQQCK